MVIKYLNYTYVCIVPNRATCSTIASGRLAKQSMVTLDSHVRRILACLRLFHFISSQYALVYIGTQPHVQCEVYWVHDSAPKLHAASATLARKVTWGASKICSQSGAIILALFVPHVYA
jgi:hypothetical protein